MVGVGVVGLGVVGSRIVKHLMRSGHDLTVYDIRAEVLEAFKGLGVRVASSVKQLSELSDVVILTLPSPKEVEEVLFSEGGVVSGLRRGGVVINLGTVGPRAALSFYERLKPHGIKYVDAAVTAPYMGYLAAERGDLTIMVGCDDDVFDEVSYILKIFGRRVIRTGYVGSAQVVKLANNVMSAIAFIGVVEGTLWAVKHGVDPLIVYEVVKEGSGDSWALRNRLPRLVEEDFTPGFKTSLMLKDVTLFLEECRDLKLFTPLVGMVYQLLQASMASGLAEMDWGALVKVYEAVNNVKITRKP